MGISEVIKVQIFQSKNEKNPNDQKMKNKFQEKNEPHK